MPTTPWNDIPLCTPDDVMAEARALEGIAFAAGPQLSGVIADKIVLAKDQIRIKLLGYLPELYVATAPGSSGYSYEELESILDLLINPQVLRNAAVAFTLRALVFEGALSNNAAFVQTETQLKNLKSMLDKECDCRLRDALTLLKIDRNRDGIASEDEHVRARKTIWPV